MGKVQTSFFIFVRFIGTFGTDILTVSNILTLAKNDHIVSVTTAAFGCQIDTFAYYNMTEAIVKEIKRGNYEKLGKLLVQAPVNWQTYDKKDGKNLLQLAIVAGCPRTLDLLLSTPGANVNSCDRENRETTLQTVIDVVKQAVLMNSNESIEKLLDRQANPLVQNRNGENAVQLAVKHDLSRILEIMSRRGVNLSLARSGEGSLLNLAIKNRCQETALWLLGTKGIDVNLTAKGPSGDTSLLLAVKENMPNIVIEILRNLEASPLSQVQKELFINAQDESGDTVLHIATRNDFIAVKGMLETKGQLFGLNDEIPNLKRETSKTVEVAKEKEVQESSKQQQRNRENKKQREKQRQEQRERQIKHLEEQEKKKQEQAQQLKQLQKQLIEKKQEQESKTRWYILGGIIVVVILLYFWLDWQIAVRRSRIGVIQ